MRGRRRNFQNRQTEQAIVCSACNPKIVSSKSRIVCDWPVSRCHSVAVLAAVKADVVETIVPYSIVRR